MEMIYSREDLARKVNEYGFLPFFKNRIKGFSVEEMTPAHLWFTDESGPWEWKGPAIGLSGGAYGKFFNNKAGFVSREWFYDFANYRRDGYDIDARFNDGLAKKKDLVMVETLEKIGPSLSKVLKKEAGYAGSDGMKGFDTIITRLMMQTYIINTNFEYAQDKNGKTYGWGIGRLATPEQHFGDSFTDLCYKREPAQSYSAILFHLKELFPDAELKDIESIIKIK